MLPMYLEGMQEEAKYEEDYFQCLASLADHLFCFVTYVKQSTSVQRQRKRQK